MLAVVGLETGSGRAGLGRARIFLQLNGPGRAGPNFFRADILDILDIDILGPCRALLYTPLIEV